MVRINQPIETKDLQVIKRLTSPYSSDWKLLHNYILSDMKSKLNFWPKCVGSVMKNVEMSISTSNRRDW